ncbi:MAG: adenylosuccinate synthetase, partial [Chloroflexota bacterium]
EAEFDGKVTRIGITRAYATRHGAGPFVTEAPHLSKNIRDAVNGYDDWQEGFRVGWLDLLLLRYGIDVVGSLDYLAVCHLDRLSEFKQLHVCNEYKHGNKTIQSLPLKKRIEDLEHQSYLTQLLENCAPILTTVSTPEALIAQLEQTLNLPVHLESWGETAVDKKGR